MKRWPGLGDPEVQWVIALRGKLFVRGDHDDRVVPAHSLKFGAELQRCQAGPGPVLLRVDTKAGHGMGKPARALAAEYADQLAFAAEHTGLELLPVPQGPADDRG